MQTTKLKSLVKLFQEFNRDWAPLSNYKYDEMLTRVSGKLTSCEGMILPVSTTLTKVQCKISPLSRHKKRKKEYLWTVEKYSTVFVTMKETNRAGEHGCCSYKEKMDMDQSMMCSIENLHCTTIDKAVTLRWTPQGKRKTEATQNPPGRGLLRQNSSV